MGIELLIAEDKSEITKENFADSVEQIRGALKPGMPVMVHNYSRSSLNYTRGNEARVLFFSGGSLDDNGKFNMQEDTNSFYVDMGKEDNSSYMIKQASDGLVGMGLPNIWTQEQYNEGTFSPEGPSRWTSTHESGTRRVLIGEHLAQEFPDAFNALRFAVNSTHFYLPIPYARQKYLITDIGERTGEDFEKDKLTHRIARIRGIMNLLELAIDQTKEFTDPFPLSASQVGWYRNGVEYFREQGYPVNAEDYLINKGVKPSKERNIVFIKTEGTLQYGEMYILPYGERKSLVELAVSDGVVGKIYPAGYVSSSPRPDEKQSSLPFTFSDFLDF